MHTHMHTHMHTFIFSAHQRVREGVGEGEMSD